MAYSGTAVLPTDSTMNPRQPSSSPYCADGLVAYVLWKVSEHRVRPTRVITSAGPMAGWRIDSEHELYHDQTGAQMGRYKVVGVTDLETGDEAGYVPDFLIKHSVVK